MKIMKLSPRATLALATALSISGGGIIGYAIGRNSNYINIDSNLPSQHLAAASSSVLNGGYYYSECEDIIESIYSTYTQYNEEIRPRYMLTAEQGFVTVFCLENSSSPRLKERTNTPEAALTPDELARLNSGIYIYTEEELARALQDYGS